MTLFYSPFIQLRTSGLCLFISVYFSLFFIASVVLFTPLFRSTTNLQPPTQYVAPKDNIPSENFEWENTLFLNLSRFDTLAGTPRGLRWPVTSSGPINCSTLHEVRDLEFVAAGWTKAVYRGVFRGVPVAIKTVNLNGHDLRECQDLQPQANLAFCYRRTAAKLLKELILLTELDHENIIKVVGSCVPDAVGPVVIATELGEPLDAVQLLQLSWQRRLQLVHSVARLLFHLAHSPLGSLAMNDLRRQQFVLVDGLLKLSDVDDMGVTEPSCQTDADCVRHLLVNITDKSVATCQRGRCCGHNERLNVWRAGQHFVHQLLPLRAPSSLEPQIQLLLEAYSDTSWGTAKILAATEQLLDSYRTAPTIFTPALDKEEYRKFSDRDLPNQFDYWCNLSESTYSCTYTVFSQEEAVALCEKDSRCKAVVVQSCQHEESCGEIKATLKNGFTTPSIHEGCLLFLKPS